MEEIKRDGVSFIGYRPERRHGIPLIVVFDREGTAIQFDSTNLGEDVAVLFAGAGA